MLLTADWHLDDKPENEYRWQVFDALHTYLHRSEDREIYVLGDLTDRKDRHSSVLTNRIVDSFRRLADYDVDVVILMGNHDGPVHDVPFWSFMSQVPGVRYVKEPRAHRDDLLLLPWSANPAEDWRGIPFKQYRAAFMHQPVSGVVTENGYKAEFDDRLPLFPRSLKVYSGDIHTPQTVRGVTYVGAPHPVKFGHTHQCRMLVLDDDYEVAEEIRLHPPRKHIVEVASMRELADMPGIRKGDQLRVRMSIDADKLDAFAVDKQAIREWADQKGLSVASIEAVVEHTPTNAEPDMEAVSDDPEGQLTAFADSEGLDDDLLNTGLRLVGKVDHARSGIARTHDKRVQELHRQDND